MITPTRTRANALVLITLLIENCSYINALVRLRQERNLETSKQWIQSATSWSAIAGVMVHKYIVSQDAFREPELFNQLTEALVSTDRVLKLLEREDGYNG